MASHNGTCHPTQVKTQPHPGRPVHDLLTPEGWKAELTLVVSYLQRMVYLFADSYPPISNRLTNRRRQDTKP